MSVIDLKSALESVSKLEITAQTTTDDASAAMQMLGDFNQCAIGLACFSGWTPWERHPDDELLYILDGEVDLKVIGERDRSANKFTLSAGSIFIVSQHRWHRQHSGAGVKLLFVTSKQGNEHSEEDPRFS
jgi:mannose-6-phosphate isomerase-like protein (cupin superfamily)